MKKKILIFFRLGIILYILDISINSNEGNEIYISDQEVLSLVSAWKSQVGRDLISSSTLVAGSRSVEDSGYSTDFVGDYSIVFQIRIQVKQGECIC